MYVTSTDLKTLTLLLWMLVAGVTFLGVIQYLRLLHETAMRPGYAVAHAFAGRVRASNALTQRAGFRMVRRRCLVDGTGTKVYRDGNSYLLQKGVTLPAFTTQWVMINEPVM